MVKNTIYCVKKLTDTIYMILGLTESGSMAIIDFANDANADPLFRDENRWDE